MTRPGNTLVLALIFMSVIAAFVVVTFDRTNTNIRSTGRRLNDQEAIRIAEAGIEKAVWCLNNPSNTTDCLNNPNYTGESNVSFGQGTFVTTVSGSGNSRTINVTATVTGSGGTSSKDLQVKLTTTTTSVAFQYGVQAGIGGIDLDGNAFISGSVYAGGNVIGKNGSYITGDAILTPNSPTLDQISDSSVSPLNLITFGSSNSTDDWVAQSFIPSLTERLFSVDLKIARHGTPSSTVTIYIYSDSSNNPDNDLSNGGQQLTVTVPNDSTGGWENGWTNQVFTPATNPILSAGTKYWLVLRTSSTNSSNNWRVVRSTTDGTYANGTAKVDGDGTAMPAPSGCASGCDIAFRTNMGGVEPKLDVPTVNGDARSYMIKDVTVGKKAYYQTLSGTVKANNGADTCTENENGPYCFDNSASQPPVNFPISDAQVAQMEAQAANGGTVTCSPTCSITNGSSIGPKRYDGDLTIVNGATVTLTGTVWVNGNLILENNSILQLSSAYGTDSGVVIADYPTDRTAKGKVNNLSNNADVRGNANPGTYIMLISMYTDPANLQEAIGVNNNMTAGVLYAPYGIINIRANGSLKEITARQVKLGNNASLVYETGLANVNFSSGPGGSWIYQKGTYQVID